MRQYKIVIPVVIISIAFIFSSCKEKVNEDMTQTINKNGAVETAVTVQHLDSLYDVLLTHHTVWYKGTAFKNVEYRDTVPALGVENKEVEDMAGYDKNVEAKKEYEIFITVK